MLAIKKLEEEIKKGLPLNIYLCLSSDLFFLSEVKKLLLENFPPLSVEVYETTEEVDKKITISSISLFSEKRIIVVYNFEKIKKLEKRIEWLEDITSAKFKNVSMLILCNASSKDIAEEINYLKKKKNVAIFNLEVSERELAEWIVYKSEKLQIKLSRSAIYYLIEITGAQPGLISSELEKISLLIDNSNVDISDIKEILTETLEYKAFDLVEAIKKKDFSVAFKIINNLQPSDYDMVLGALNWHFSNRIAMNERVYSLLYSTNVALRQGKSCSLELLLYELLKD
ncbi:hypothetical protein [Thermodesulfovibrio sp.]|uniref:DNA polymerase III subunit delta n=1 Tax=Thermodesulfovibrio sp. TaxID=2067987 RepID=UPI0030A2007E